MLSQSLIDAGFQLAQPELNTTRFYHPIFGTIDIETLTIEDAERLVKSGFPGLIYIKPSPITHHSSPTVEPLLVVNDSAIEGNEVEVKPARKNNK